MKGEVIDRGRYGIIVLWAGNLFESAMPSAKVAQRCAASEDLAEALRNLLADAEAAGLADGPNAGSLIEARAALVKAGVKP